MMPDKPTPAEGGHERPRFAYMLLTHREPRDVEELASRLLDLSPDARVVLHHDLASEHVPWNGRPPARVHLVDRNMVQWGDWSIVEATLRMVRYAVEQLDADWFVMLSGEHRPIADLQEWERAVVASGVDAFVEADALPRRLRFGRKDEDRNRFLARCVHRWVTIAEPRLPAGHRALGGVWKLSRYVEPCATLEYSHRRHAWFLGIPRPRGPLRGWSFYKGSQWVAFDRAAADAVLGTDPAVTAWFSRGHIPDETYLQTVLRRRTDLVVRNQSVTFVPPPEPPGPGRRMILDSETLHAAWASGAAFARKVDPETQPGIIRAIDAEVERRRSERLASGAPHEPSLGVARPTVSTTNVLGGPCVAVVGMHRSGTSATAGLLINLGLAGPRPQDLVPADSSNERGHWESQAVHLCNAGLLAANGATTYSPPSTLLPWERTPGIEDLRARAADWFNDTYDGRPLMIKDPRLCLTMPFWKNALPVPLGAVLVLRDPMAVARSLQARDDIPTMLGLALWDRYLRSAAAGLEGMPTLVVEYDAMLADAVKAVESMSNFLEQLGVRIGPGTRDGAAQQLAPQLRHHDTDPSEFDALAEDLREVSAILSDRAGPHSAWQPPTLPPAPPWVDEVLQLQHNFSAANHELHWVKASGPYRLASALWRLTGRTPSELRQPGSGGEVTR